MARRKYPPIVATSYVHVGSADGPLVCTDDLTPEQKTQLATKIRCTILNTLYAGEYEFFPAEQHPDMDPGTTE